VNRQKPLYLLLMMLSFASLIPAQTREFGSFIGAVFNIEGDRLPGVSITAKSTTIGLVQSTTTNEEGHYRIEGLPRGPYQITAVLPGFKTLIKEGLELSFGAEVKVDFTLEVGMIEEEMTVTATAPLVETTRAQVSTTITEKEFLSYPQADRNYLSLIKYAPGTVPYEGRSGYAINGQRASSNNFMIDGIDNNDISTATSATTSLPPEAIQEFRLVTNSFSAEYGRNTGGIIEAVMKSGTNEIHGSAWAFYSGSGSLFTTEDWLTHERLPYDRWKYGGTVGGPITKDKTFFFLSFEGVKDRRPSWEPYYFFTPEAIGRAEGAAKYFFDHYGANYPVPTSDFIDIDGDGLTDAGKYIWDGAVKNDGMNLGIKIDHLFGEKDRISLRWLYNAYEDSWNFANVPGVRKEIPTRYHTGGVTWLHIFNPTMYNEVRLGYHRDYHDWPRVAPEIPSLGGYTYFNDGVHAIGDWGQTPQKSSNNTYQLVEVLNFQTGNHSIKAGGEMRLWNSESTFDSNVAGNYYFFDSTWFLYDLGAYYLILGCDPPDPPVDNPYIKGDPFGEWKRGNSFRKWKGLEGGLFIQDDWRVTERFTLTVGLRWEYFGVPQETSGRGINMPAFGTEKGYENTVAGNYDITEGSENREGIKYLIFDGRELNKEGLWNPYYKAFAPKISFAYDLTGDGKTSVRGGWGLSYDRIFNQMYENDRFNYPDFTFAGFSADPMIMATIPATVPMANVAGYRAALRWMQPDLKPQKAYNWLLGIQRELAPNVLLEVNYTGSAGRNLGSIQRPNRFTGDRLDGRRDGINSQVSITDCNLREQRLKSYYNALSVILNKKFDNGWSWYTAYNYGLAKDQNSDYFGDDSGMEAVSQDWLQGEYSYAQFDRRHRLVGGFVWQIPYWKNSTNWILKNLLAGWQLAGNFHWTSGQPFTIRTGSISTDWNYDWDSNDRPLWTGGDYDELITWTNGSPGWDRSHFAVPAPPAYANDLTYYSQNFAPRNGFRWFPTYNLDISLQKYFVLPLAARNLTFQVIIDIFNVFLNRFWSLPSTYWHYRYFGTSFRMYGDRTLQLSLRILF
jgi:outer membrane receptor protein involved in Fe transport